MNSRALLGEFMPAGARRVRWNVLMILALSLALFGSLWAIWSKAGVWGMAGLGVFVGLCLVVHWFRPPTSPATPPID